MKIVKEIFRSYDIRGLYEKELTNDLAYLIGKGFGTISNGTVIVGHDARTSSNALNTNFIKGLIETGTKVIDLGLVTTPMLYYARELLKEPYAVMITASHCAKEYNSLLSPCVNSNATGERLSLFTAFMPNASYISGYFVSSLLFCICFIWLSLLFL